jgi:outer membrane immunogenic protein
MSGGFVGGQIGYNFHLSDSVVLGVQGDLEWANIAGSQTGPTISDTINWTGAVTARLGYDVDGFLPYVLGGVAFANSARTGVNSVVNSQVHTGYTVGVGVETMLADNLSAFAEVRYSDYGQKTYTLPSTPIVGLTDTSVRIGLNYHF